jgi:hypothetical protein
LRGSLLWSRRDAHNHYRLAATRFALTGAFYRAGGERTSEVAGGQRFAGSETGGVSGFDLVKVDYAACHHVALLTPEVLSWLGLGPGQVLYQ